MIDRADDQGEQGRAQRALGRAELERLVVVGVDLGDVHADADVVVVAEVERCTAETPDGDGLAQVGRGSSRRRTGCRCSPTRPSPRWMAANPPVSVRIVVKQSPKPSVPSRRSSRTLRALRTACWRATSARCSSRDERAKA